MNNTQNFIELVNSRKSVVGIIGMGYVGLPLAIEFSHKNFKVIGFDIDEKKVSALNSGKSYIKHIKAESIQQSQKSGFVATTNIEEIRNVNSVLICVPTPLGEHLEPDLTYIVSTAEAIGPYIQKGQLITLESTTYPGTTEEVMIPVLERLSGLKAGVDFYVAFSPEREDPNNTDFSTSTIPKVVGGYSPDCLKVAIHLYNQIIVKTVPVSSCAAAEATKLLENIFRSINIALVNELKVIFSKMNIDVWEVIEAAKTKPFGYMPFYPGPGLGGHCIPIDPFYLTWKAKEYGVATRFIELAGEINTSMPDYVVHETMLAMNKNKKALNGSKVLIVGLAYKGDVDDMRESPSLRLIHLFEHHGAEVEYYDPYIPVVPPTREHAELTGRKSITLDQVKQFDVAVIATKHSSVDHTIFAKVCQIVIDTRNALDRDLPNVFKA